MTSTPPIRRPAAWLSMLALAAMAWCVPAAAANTDIASAPLFTSSNTQVKPNIMFILDDSGSMASDYLPDVSNFSSTKYGKKASQCNGVAYNPTITYSPPKNADGTTQANASQSVITSLSNPLTQTTSQRTISGTVAMPTTLTGTMSFTVTGSSFTSTTYQPEQAVTIFQNNDSSRFFTGEVVSWNRTSSSQGTLVVDISVGFMEGTGSFSAPRVGRGLPQSPTYYTYSGSQTPLSYTYTSSGVITTTTFYQECNSTVGSAPGSGVFTAVSVTASSAEAQNYANWSTFYSTRMAMMKSSVSRAFATLDNRYRVGYSTISERTAVSGDNFLDISDFDATQKTNFYSKLNGADPGGNTPLRGALSKAGQYYAKLANGQTVDPVQYSCQRNYTILSTDGYWNTGSESSTSPKYGPYRLDNTTSVGQQDGSGTARPMNDGNTVTTTYLDTWTVTSVVRTTALTPQTSTSTVTRSTTTVAPVSGQTSFTYDLLTNTSVSSSALTVNGSSSRPTSGQCGSGCTVTVTQTGHGFLNGDTVVVTGNSGWGTSGATVTVIDADHFTYNITSRPGNGANGSYNVALSASSSCSVGSGKVTRKYTQVRDVVNTQVTTTVDSTFVTSTSSSVTTRTTTTPYTTTTVEIEGVMGTPSTAAGTPSTQTGAAVVTTIPGTTTTSSSTSNVNNGNTFSPWVRTAAAPTTTTLGSCTSTVPADTSATASAGVNTTTTVTTGGPTNGGPTVTTGTTTSSNSTPSVTESTHATSSSSSSSGGVSNSLADVAMYYYKTDLRDSSLSNCTGALGTDVCTNNVPGSTASAQRSFGDAAAWQHMTTFTLGLGVGGLLTFDPNYLSQSSGDFVDILSRSQNWPSAGSTKGPENIDDLWHAAVNGRGQYFSAGDPTSLTNALTGALDSIQAITGAAAAASTSSLQPVEGDNDVFVAQFTSVKWTGDVLSYRIDPNAGTISTTPVWSAKTRLDAKAPSARTIYYPNPVYSQTLRTFNVANLTTDNYISYFSTFCSKTGAGGASAPSQCATLTDTTAANTASNLVNYLRGDQTLSYYRTRDARLGDIISASPLFVGKPSFKYTENAYGAFAAAKASRTAVVLTAANDGMLHAFDRDTGDELWAFMPSSVLPNLYKLADNAYATNHQYYVDGSPQMGDIWDGTNWKTIVVGGLNAGGKSYYALDVTNPAAPKFMWEFSNPNLGLTFGNPIITKRTDGTWIVAFTSGYNNNAGGGDGNGHLFILNANTGALITQLPTNYPNNTAAGDVGTPSGLAKLNVWVNAVENNTALRFYAGDLLGNLWRFDIDSQVAPNNAALLLATLTSPDGTRQSITTRPSLAEITYNGIAYPVAFVTTGRYLGTTDASSTAVQSIYAIKDPMIGTGWGTAGLRTTNTSVLQTLSVSTDANGNAGRTVANQAVDWSTKSGWYADFPVGGERVTVNAQISLSTITVGTILPSSSACTVGGQSFLYRFDTTSGASTSGTSTIGVYVGNVLIQGLTNVQLGGSGSGAGSIVTITTRSDATLQTDVTAVPTSAANLRRTSWRELAD